jgi:hypothetical protein
MAKEGSKLSDLEARVAFLEKPRQEVVLTMPDGKFTVKLSLNLANLALNITAELLDEHGNPVPTAGENKLAYWQIRQGTLLREG